MTYKRKIKTSYRTILFMASRARCTNNKTQQPARRTSTRIHPPPQQQQAPAASSTSNKDDNDDDEDDREQVEGTSADSDNSSVESHPPLRGRGCKWINFPQVYIFLLDTVGGVICTSGGVISTSGGNFDLNRCTSGGVTMTVASCIVKSYSKLRP